MPHSLPFIKIREMPIREPRRLPIKVVSKTPFQPKTPPTIAINLISPPPIASFLNTALPDTAIT